MRDETVAAHAALIANLQPVADDATRTAGTPDLAKFGEDQRTRCARSKSRAHGQRPTSHQQRRDVLHGRKACAIELQGPRSVSGMPRGGRAVVGPVA